MLGLGIVVSPEYCDSGPRRIKDQAKLGVLGVHEKGVTSCSWGILPIIWAYGGKMSSGKPLGRPAQRVKETQGTTCTKRTKIKAGLKARHKAWSIVCTHHPTSHTAHAQRASFRIQDLLDHSVALSLPIRVGRLLLYSQALRGAPHH